MSPSEIDDATTEAPDGKSSMFAANSVAAWIAVAIAAALVVLSATRLKRTGGRIWRYHAYYFIIVAIVVVSLPDSVDKFIFRPAGVAVVGTIFPVIESLRAICTPATADDTEWLQYWVAAGSVMFITAYLKDYESAGEYFQLYWYQFEFFFFIWLYFPFTDGSTLCFDFITKPFLSPVIDPLSEKMNSWISGLVLTVVNASHIWALWAFFIILPVGLKRFVTIAIGTVFPLFASVTAVSTEDTADDTYWLTYWSCYGLLFLIMDWLETWLGRIWGFYTLVIFSTVYLMLPMTMGSEKVFRHVLVPLAGMQENLLMRDAVLLKKELLANFPPDKQIELRRLITYSFNTETPDDDEEDHGGIDNKMEIKSMRKLWAENLWNRKNRKRNSQRQEGGDGAPTETTSLVV